MKTFYIVNNIILSEIYLRIWFEMFIMAKEYNIITETKHIFMVNIKFYKYYSRNYKYTSIYPKSFSEFDYYLF